MFFPTTLKKSFEFSIDTAACAASAPSSASSSGVKYPLNLLRTCTTPMVRPCWFFIGTQRMDRVRYPVRRSQSASKRTSW